jgi:hypothetical protein
VESRRLLSIFKGTPCILRQLLRLVVLALFFTGGDDNNKKKDFPVRKIIKTKLLIEQAIFKKIFIDIIQKIIGWL